MRKAAVLGTVLVLALVAGTAGAQDPCEPSCADVIDSSTSDAGVGALVPIALAGLVLAARRRRREPG